MFEEESENYSNNWQLSKNNNLNFAELVELRGVIYQSHKDGAEFGYNKCFEQIKKLVNESTRLDCIIPELLRLQEEI